MHRLRPGLELVCRTLRRRGATNLAVEAYGHRLHREIIEAAGLGTTTMAVDDAGAVVDDLAEAGAALLTPAHQFPLGVVLDPARRRQAVAWAAVNGATVLEDDYDGEFRYDRQAVGAMQSLAPGQVIYAGTASKSLVPGLRLGWLALPAPLLDEVVEAKRTGGAGPSALDQLTMAELLRSGAFDRQVRRARLAYRRRRDRLLEVLAQLVPPVEVRGIAAGLHALVHLPGRDEDEIVARAADRGLALEGLGAYTEPGYERGPALVIGYGTPPDHAYTATLSRLAATLSVRDTSPSAVRFSASNDGSLRAISRSAVRSRHDACVQRALLAQGFGFVEGPRWRDGRLVFSDMASKQVLTVDLDGAVAEVCVVEGRPSGIGWLPDGRMLVVSMVDRSIVRLEPDGTLAKHADLSDLVSAPCNDMVVDERGNAYVGNPGYDMRNPPSPLPTAEVVLVRPDGSAEVVDRSVLFPNGPAVTPDGRTLIVAETMGRRLSAFDIDEDGTLSNRRTYADLPGRAPDGIALDAQGAVWVADASGNACVRVREGGEITDVVDTGRGCFACALGGPERKTLFLLTGEGFSGEAIRKRTGAIETVQVAVPGAGLP